MKEKLIAAGKVALKAAIVAFIGAIAGGAIAPEWIQQIASVLVGIIGG